MSAARLDLRGIAAVNQRLVRIYFSFHLALLPTCPKLSRVSPPAPILLVEDDSNDALFATRALRKAGVASEIIHLSDGEEAINYLSCTPPFQDRGQHPLPSLILLDLKMPKYSGFDVLTWLRGKPDLLTIPVVVLTGSIYPEDRTRAQNLGAVGYEVKPVEFNDVITIAKKIKLPLGPP